VDARVNHRGDTLFHSVSCCEETGLQTTPCLPTLTLNSPASPDLLPMGPHRHARCSVCHGCEPTPAVLAHEPGSGNSQRGQRLEAASMNRHTWWRGMVVGVTLLTAGAIQAAGVAAQTPSAPQSVRPFTRFH